MRDGKAGRKSLEEEEERSEQEGDKCLRLKRSSARRSNAAPGITGTSPDSHKEYGSSQDWSCTTKDLLR